MDNTNGLVAIMNLDLIKNRRSVRTYDGNGLSLDELELINNLIDNIDNPFNEKVKYILLNAKDNDLSSPVIVGENYYLISIINKKDNYQLALGYTFEDLILKLEEKCLSSVMLAGTYKKDLFLKAINLSEDEDIIIVSPVGHKANKMSTREKLMRKGVDADNRLEFSKLFFENDFEHQISKSSEFYEALEALRLAPSAANKQPWRVLLNNEGAHFYKKENKGYESIQLVDIGIALRHFTIFCNKEGYFDKKDPQTSNNELKYIISYTFK